MNRYAQIYWLMVRNSLIREMSFKANFLLWMVVELLWFFGQIVFIEVLFQYVDQIGDWTKWQVVALLGSHQIIAQLFQAFFFVNLSELPELIRTGRLDILLVLPIDPQFAVSTRKFGLDNVVNALVGLAIVGFALAHLHYLPGAGQVGFFLVALLLGVAAHYSIMFALCTCAFWIVRAQGLVYGYFNLFNIGRYPDTVFHGIFKVVFSYVVPIILVANVPTRAITGKLEHPLLALGELAGVSLLVVLGTRWFFHLALRRYSSASS